MLVTSRPIPGSAENRRLGGTLADVTAEAGAEAAMSDARDEADEASRLKSDFLANMSHEIRTPMNGVIGMTDLLLETDLDARQRDYAQTVRNSGEALLTIINDILDFSKVEAGKLELEYIDCDLRDVVGGVVRLLAGSAEAKGLDLSTVIDREVPPVVTSDPGRVRQVLTNLIGNAIKFTHAGDVFVRVTRGPIADSPETIIRFEVSDTGDGVAPDKLATVFQPFVQADTSTSRRYGGTGLGLAISSQLVSLMGGACGVSSQLGAGSIFAFTIRVAVEPAGPQPASGSMPTALAPSTAVVPVAAPAHGRLLLAEDNLINQKVAVAMLSGAGYEVDTVPDGAAAVRAIRSQAYDAVLMDCQMPEMNGFEATAAIRSHERGSGHRTPIIALTAGAREEDREACLAEGMDGYLAKPLGKDALLTLVGYWVGRDRPALPCRGRSRRSADLAAQGRVGLLEGALDLVGERGGVLQRAGPRHVLKLPAQPGHPRCRQGQASALDLMGVAADRGGVLGADGVSKPEQAIRRLGAEELHQFAQHPAGTELRAKLRNLHRIEGIGVRARDLQVRRRVGHPSAPARGRRQPGARRREPVGLGRESGSAAPRSFPC